MPSLEELRRWLRGGKVEALPDWEERDEESGEDETVIHAKVGRVSKTIKLKTTKVGKKGKIDPAKMKKRSVSRRDGRFTLSADGRDAKLNFGTHRGASVSDLLETEPDYLEWILRADDPDKDPFPEALLEVVRAYLRHKKPPKAPRAKDDDDPFDDELLF